MTTHGEGHNETTGYDGRVHTQGPTALRRLDEVDIRKARVGALGNNAYLLTCRRSGHQLLIDAAADSDRLLEVVREGSPSTELGLIVTTHRHRDHHGALEDLVAVTGARTAAGAEDAEAIPVPTHRLLRHGDTVTVGHLSLEVVSLRGHTPGSVALLLIEPSSVDVPGAVAGRAHLFTGDSLFPGGLGNTDHDAARFTQLFDDVTSRVFDRLPDDTWVYPGHGDDTTLGAERPHLKSWRERGW
ncbi:Glyoxylase, beta-lactamase superfamily II [Sanguibacter gelidistatuariae]|uniref:Glyoxylase, beta-lactamase superfamily II n=1 Tax=Sanguibacter gelidistatuariae TaxID=1814289 RepID=A0A1G6T862_9MICO|nr:MBL fold metallo-hydrolase [Sanguibacter gelidistatuariae]SDD25322.1 Glyoxylase, beta-lactamase superfamily II [Sanguibacter gelidistatuariae]